MNRILCALALVATASLASPQPAEAQGFGALLDYIHKLSGPTLLGPSANYFADVGPVRLRGTVGYLTSVDSDDVIDPDGSAVNTLALEPAVEWDLIPGLGVGAGLSLNRFSGDFDDSFWHLSVPLYLQGRIPLGGSIEGAGLKLRLGAGAEYFPAFDATDFAPITTGVETDGGEWTFMGFLGFDWVIG